MDIVERLRGVYRTPLTDGLGAAGGDEPDNSHEFVRKFETPPIQHEAAEEIVKFREVLAFYAEWGIDAPAVDAIIEEDRGDKARAALNIVLANLEKDDY